MAPPKLEKRVNDIPVSPLCDIEKPIHQWTPGVRGGKMEGEGSKFINYIKSKTPGLAPAGWKDITPYFGKEWPKSLSAWRTAASKAGFYMSVRVIEKLGQEPYRAILVCLNPR